MIKHPGAYHHLLKKQHTYFASIYRDKQMVQTSWINNFNSLEALPSKRLAVTGLQPRNTLNVCGLTLYHHQSVVRE